MKKLKFILLILLLVPVKNYGQFWPINPMIRLGNVVYYNLETEEAIKLTKSHAVFDNNVENRFFDILTDKDSIGLKLDGEIIYFSQKSRKEPSNFKNILFYSRRFLRNEDSKIKYLEIKEILDDVIIAEATIKHKNQGSEKQLVEIELADLDGVFIGPGEKQRTATYILSWGAGIGAGIFLFSR